VANEAESRGLWSGLPCVHLDESFASQLRTAAKSPGSYYTSNTWATLVLIPQMKVVIYSWWD